MGSGFFGQLGQKLNNLAGATTDNLLPRPFAGRMGTPAVNPGTAGPYSGVAPSLAGANAGYGGAVQVGANPYAAASPVNPYVYAARQATGQ